MSEVQSHIQRVIDFLESYTEYNLQTSEDYLSEDGRLSESAELRESIPYLRLALSNLVNAGLPTDQHDLEVAKVAFDRGKRFVNPHFKYLIVNSSVSGIGYLTDDIGKALEKTACESRFGDMWYLLSIVETPNGWVTRQIGYSVSGHYEEISMRTNFLHYQFINESCKLTKLE